MADNVGYTPGTGAIVAADEISGVLFQRVKPVIGGDGVAVDLKFGQSLAAASLPVVLASDAAVSVSQSGTWNIGTVATLPALAAGGNTIGAVNQAGAPWADNITQIGGTAIAAGSGLVNAGTQRVTLATDVALPTGSNVIGAVTQSGTWNIGTVTTLPALATGANTIGGVNLTQYTPASGRLPVDGSGVTQPVSIATLPALATGANTIGAVNQAGTWTTNISSGAGINSYFHAVSLASTNSTLISTGIHTLGFIHFYNTTATVKYVKLYMKATAPTVGTDTPSVTFAMPPNKDISMTFTVGLRFLLGLGYGITGGSADSDTTAVAAGDVIVNFGYA